MNERLDELRRLLNELNEMKQPYIIQRDNAEDMIEEINFRIDEVNDEIEQTVKGRDIGGLDIHLDVTKG